MTSRRRRRLRHRAPIVVLAVALLGTSCAGSSVGDAVRAASGEQSEPEPGQGAEFEEDRRVNIDDLDLGECFNNAFANGKVTIADVVPCDEPHYNELYVRYELQEAEFPGDERVVDMSLQGCIDRFAEFTGIAYGQTPLEITYFYPTALTWNTQDDREVACAVHDVAGEATGTLEGRGDEYAFAYEGDCMDEAWLKVDCADAHYAEVYLDRELGGSYPGDAAVESKVAGLCEEAFAEFVGTKWAESDLDYAAWTPTQKSWDTGYTVVSCAVFDPAGPLTGSVQDSGR